MAPDFVGRCRACPLAAFRPPLGACRYMYATLLLRQPPPPLQGHDQREREPKRVELYPTRTFAGCAIQWFFVRPPPPYLLSIWTMALPSLDANCAHTPL